VKTLQAHPEMWPAIDGPSDAIAEVSGAERLATYHPLESIAGTLAGYRLLIPVALKQVNLKLPPAVLALWRAQAAAEGLSVRDWLISVTGAPTAPQVAAAGDPELAERVAALEAAIADLAGQVAALVPLPSPPVNAAPPEAMEAPAGALTTAELAMRTGTNRAAWNNWARPERIGQVRSHRTGGEWRLAGRATAATGGPPRWLWEPVSTRELPGQPHA
jgi:hypothetical protein